MNFELTVITYEHASHPVAARHAADLFSKTIVRLMLAAFLGGSLGWSANSSASRRGCAPICLYASFCNVHDSLQRKLAGEMGQSATHTRIAAQIIPGIGFMVQVSILHDKGGVAGSRRRPTIFVVASNCMAAGGGLYLEGFLLPCSFILR